MSISLVQNPNGISWSSGTQNFAYPSNNTKGNLLLVVGYLNGGNTQTATITDTAGNVWTTSYYSGGTSWTLFISYVLNCKAGANTVSILNSTPTQGGAIYLAEFSGPTSFDKTASGVGTSQTPSTSSVNVSSPSELLIGLSFTAAAVTQSVGTNFSLGSNNHGEILWEYRIVSALGSYAATSHLSASALWSIALNTFAAPSSGTGQNNKSFSTIGNTDISASSWIGTDPLRGSVIR